MPPAGDMSRYRVQQWLAFVATELHKSFSPFFKPATPEETKAASREHLAKRIKFVDGKLDGQSFLMGETFSVADAYLGPSSAGPSMSISTSRPMPISSVSLARSPHARRCRKR